MGSGGSKPSTNAENANSHNNCKIPSAEQSKVSSEKDATKGQNSNQTQSNIKENKVETNSKPPVETKMKPPVEPKKEPPVEPKKEPPVEPKKEPPVEPKKEPPTPPKKETQATIKAGETSKATEGAGLRKISPEEQAKFDTAVSLSGQLVKPESLLRLATEGVHKLELRQALPHSISLFTLLEKLTNLQIVDIAGNQLGPAGFRAVMLALCHNSTVRSLNIADNQTDTDSAECVGKMLRANRHLSSLDLSGNSLGLDFFSRCVGPALAENNTLTMLRCDSIGSTDLKVFGEGLRKNRSLEVLSLSSNELSNPQSFMDSLAVWIKEPACPLKSLSLRNVGLKGGCFDSLTQAIAVNSKLESLEISANSCLKTSTLLLLVLTCICRPAFTALSADDTRIDSGDTWQPAENLKPDSCSSLRTLSLSGCALNDPSISALRSHLGHGTLTGLGELNLANNPDLTAASLLAFAELSSPKPGAASDIDQHEGNEPPVSTPPPPVTASAITRLSLGHNPGDHLPELLLSNAFPILDYLNLRRAKISASALEQLAPRLNGSGRKGKSGPPPGGSFIGTLVLDGIKLANTGVFNTLIGPHCQLVALSLASCQLNDADLSPLSTALRGGAPVSMVKLSDNRLSDEFVCSLCDALQSKKGQPLSVLDLCSNRITSKGAKRIADFLTSKYKPQLHSLNIAFNDIDSAGLASLASCLTRTPLCSLNASKQNASFLEEDCDKIFQQLAKALGLKYIQEGEGVKTGTADIPAKLPEFISCKLTGIGGNPGALGTSLHCRAIQTDAGDSRLTHLTLQHALQLAAYLKDQESPELVLSNENWSAIIGTKDTPTWLQVATHRERAVFLSALPASVTPQKLEGLLETEADCNVQEICLMKDLVTRKNNGLAWVLMSDAESAERALQLYHRGEACMFSQPFSVSRVCVRVDDGASAEAQARQDLAARASERTREEAAHRALIESSYQESQARHAYRLAHPAYADGRIW